MRRWIALGAIFLISLCVFLIALMPAVVLVRHLPALRPGGAPLTFSNAHGRWWDGTMEVAWRDQRGTVSWRLDWRGLTPGVRLNLQDGDLKAGGWLGAAWGNWRLAQWRGSVPVDMVGRYVPQGNATGTVNFVLLSLELADHSVVDAKGTLNYSGGTVTWGQGGSAPVPPLDGRLSMEKTGPVLVVTGPRKQQLVRAGIANGKFDLKVRRAWPQLLGVSQGGNPSDVVFQMTQPVALGG